MRVAVVSGSDIVLRCNSDIVIDLIEDGDCFNPFRMSMC